MNDYTYYFKKLANPGERIPVDLNHPEPGFYRTKAGNSVAIWIDEDGLNIAFDDEPQPQHQHERVWTSCADRPVPEDWYVQHRETGRWPDVDKNVAAIGQNRMEADIEGLIEDLAAAADDYTEVSDDATAAQAQTLRDRLLGLKSRADKQRVEEKEPHLKAGRAVDERWMPWVKKAQGAADRIRAAISLWETKKREEARRRADEAARAAAAGLEAPREEPEPAPAAQVRGGTGRAASVREVTICDTIVSWPQLAAHYAHRPSVQEAILKAVAHDLRDGHEVPFITTKQVAAVR